MGWILLLANAVVPVLPLVPLLGYLVRALVGSAAGRGAPPSARDDTAELLRSGFGASLILVVYLALPMVVIGGMAIGLADRFDAGIGGGFVLISGGTISLGLVAIALYLLPVGLVSFGECGSIRAAVDHKTLRPIASHARYFIGWIRGLVALAVGGTVASALVSVHHVGWIFAGLVGAYSLLIVVRFWGRAVGLANDSV